MENERKIWYKNKWFYECFYKGSSKICSELKGSIWLSDFDMEGVSLSERLLVGARYSVLLAFQFGRRTMLVLPLISTLK